MAQGHQALSAAGMDGTQPRRPAAEDCGLSEANQAGLIGFSYVAVWTGHGMEAQQRATP